MKRSLLVTLVFLTVLSSSCSIGSGLIGDRVDPGNVGFLIDNYGDQGGVENAKLFSGGKRVTYNSFSHSFYEFPTFYQTHQYVDSDSVNFSMGGSQASMPLGVTYRFTTDAVEGNSKEGYTKVHEFFKTYRVSPSEFNATTLRNGLRDCATTVAGSGNPVQFATNPGTFQEPLEKCLQGKFPVIDIKEISFLGAINLPEGMQGSINRSLQAKQEAETAVANKQKAEAEAAALVAEANGRAQVKLVEATAEAEANRLLNASITDNVLQLKRLEIDAIRAEKYPPAQTVIQTGNVQIPTVNPTP